MNRILLFHPLSREMRLYGHASTHEATALQFYCNSPVHLDVGEVAGWKSKSKGDLRVTANTHSTLCYMDTYNECTRWE
jgi:hypothetical protein